MMFWCGCLSRSTFGSAGTKLLKLPDEAMTVLLHKETVIDIVFTDIEMPGTLDGFGLAKWVREHRPGLDVILAGTLPRTIKQAEVLCDEGPIPKPYDAQLVHNRIRRLLAARQGAKRSD